MYMRLIKRVLYRAYRLVRWKGKVYTDRDFVPVADLGLERKWDQWSFMLKESPKKNVYFTPRRDKERTSPLGDVAHVSSVAKLT